MVLFLELLTLNDGEIALFKRLNGLVENLRDVSTTKLSVLTVAVNLISIHCFL